MRRLRPTSTIFCGRYPFVLRCGHRIKGKGGKEEGKGEKIGRGGRPVRPVGHPLDGIAAGLSAEKVTIRVRSIAQQCR